MENKLRTFFLIAGTLLFSFIVYGLATSDYKSKKARLAPNAQTLIGTKIYKKPDLKSKVIDSLPENKDILIGKEYGNFYKIINAKDHPDSNAGFILKETVVETK
ncbi:SH3 domain-containing protein [Flavobacterium supellecticarium]|uniref:SH3 domain-containing protein n=1 Tax=Flavobacterium supellecticarium TaxID=2565924 RepID=A0A4S4A3I7_9FLAO|nr:SH3 domain-containing protein [Flavobacterium supellecticarium]THF52994.1 SH3 domain-containing protein [Flavobacterium supellecticarium]